MCPDEPDDESDDEPDEEPDGFEDGPEDDCAELPDDCCDEAPDESVDELAECWDDPALADVDADVNTLNIPPSTPWRKPPESDPKFGS